MELVMGGGGNSSDDSRRVEEGEGHIIEVIVILAVLG